MSKPTRPYTAGDSPPCCAMACSDTWSSRSHWSTSCADAPPPVALVSIMTANANATAVRPALERRWDDALAAFDARTGIGVLGRAGRADTVEEVSELLQRPRRRPVALVRGVAVRRLARVQRSRAGPQRYRAGGGDSRGRTRGEPARPLPAAQPGISSAGTQTRRIKKRAPSMYEMEGARSVQLHHFTDCSAPRALPDWPPALNTSLQLPVTRPLTSVSGLLLSDPGSLPGLSAAGDKQISTRSG